MIELNDDERRRYARHLALPEVGSAGQARLKAASVLVVGAGGLGSPLCMYLAAAGVGRIGIVDPDVVDETNLQRQIVHGESTVGTAKVESARNRLIDVNANVQVAAYEERLTTKNAPQLFRGYDVVADATDNFDARYLINDVCIAEHKPNVQASVFRFEGQLAVFDPGRGPCYRCLYPDPPAADFVPSCAEAGILGVVPGVLGTLQATEVIKLLLGLGRCLIGHLLLFDALSMTFRVLSVPRDADCVSCGNGNA